jgi:hypothetical protein
MYVCKYLLMHIRYNKIISHIFLRKNNLRADRELKVKKNDLRGRSAVIALQ